LNPRAKKVYFWVSKRGVKGYKIWESKYNLSSDVTFDEVSMMKPTDSQKVERNKTT